MGNEYFKFKKFTIKQDKCAMKVGTDGVLLGAWTNAGESTNIADIGAGTGLISIMLAQKCNAVITGIEVDEDACIQALENMKASPWKDRLNVIKADITDYYSYHKSEYDLIVSNPPFYKEKTKGYSEKRNMARHTDGLDFNTITMAASFMLKEKGRFCVILPYISANEFIGDAASCKLYLKSRTDVITKPGATPKRVLLEFRKGQFNVETEISELLLSENGEKSEVYKALTSDFYL